MHWGVYNKEGDQMACTYTTVKVRIRGNQSVVEITYRYKLDGANAVEYYFPMCEVPGLDTLQVQYKQENSQIPFTHMSGKLYEQTPDGETKAWTAPEEEEEDASETQSLLGSFFGGAKKASSDKSRAIFYYFYGTSPELEELDGTKDLLVKIVYVSTCKVEKQQYEENDIVNFSLPLTIFSQPPNQWDVQLEMRDFIRKIRPKLQSQKVFAEITGKKAICRFHDQHPLGLEDEMLTLMIELGEPIEPHCADPVALFIFATFVGLMVWFSLTKELH